MDVPRHYVCVLIQQSSENTRKTTSPYSILKFTSVSEVELHTRRTVTGQRYYYCFIIIIIIIIIAIELSLGGSSPYTSTDKTNKNKCT